MPDKTKRGRQDAVLVSLDHEIVFWMNRFGVSRERLTEAVAAVGNSYTKVGEYLKRQRGRQ